MNKEYVQWDFGSTKGSELIASFDLDWTIIKPKSGRKFPKDKDDWKLLFKDTLIKEKLKDLHDNNRIIITEKKLKNTEALSLKNNLVFRTTS